MDGHFVPNITMGAPILEHVKKNVPDIFMDCHMMVSNPQQVRAGAIHAVSGTDAPLSFQEVSG